MGVVLKEAMYVVIFLKPGVDAYRVASGKEQHELELFEPMLEMVSDQKLILCTVK